MTEIYECVNCGAVVQGWHAAHEWYARECIPGKVHEWRQQEEEHVVKFGGNGIRGYINLNTGKGIVGYDAGHASEEIEVLP